MCSWLAADRISRPVFFLGFALLLLSACDQGAGESDETSSSEPRPEVTLPPVPQIDVERPVVHPDGSLTVWGLSERLTEYLGQRITVTGYVRHKYVCENREAQEARDELIRSGQLDETAEGTGEAPEAIQAILERCNYPHLYIVDRLNARRELLITGYTARSEERLLVGQQYTFTGRFMEETRGFRRAGQGLLFSLSIRGGNLDEPPPPEAP